jgi:phosphatidylglycerophosphatase C
MAHTRYYAYSTVTKGISLKNKGMRAAAIPWVALFDLDGTLTWHDTLLPFSLAFWRYWRDRDRGALKSSVIRMLLGGEQRAVLDAYATSFVARLKGRLAFRPLALAVLEAHREAGDHLVLLSASPDLYVPKIGELLGFERTVCTELQWRGDRLDGHLRTANRRGEEKLACLNALRQQYQGLRFIAYGNSASDLDHLRHADRALLVNGDSAARRLAAKFEIAVSNWS